MLYASTWSDEVNGVEIWRSATGNAGDWTKVVDNGFGNTNNSGAIPFTVFGSNLYAGTYNLATGGQLWRTDTGDLGDWQQVNTSGFGTLDNTVISALSVFNGYLYAGTNQPIYGTAQIWRCQVCNGTDWENVSGGWSSGTRVMPSLEVANNNMYAVIGNNLSGLEVWRTEGFSEAGKNSVI